MASAVAVLALPVKAPVNPVEVTDVKPAIVVLVLPKLILVEPKVIELFANCPFRIPALLDKLLVVNPVADIVLLAIEMPDPAVNASCLPLNTS